MAGIQKKLLLDPRLRGDDVLANKFLLCTKINYKKFFITISIKPVLRYTLWQYVNKIRLFLVGIKGTLLHSEFLS